MNEETNEDFSLVDTTKSEQSPKNPKIIVAYQDATIKELRDKIERLNTKIDRVHWINTIARIGYIAFNPTFHFQNASKDFLYRSAYYIFKQFV